LLVVLVINFLWLKFSIFIWKICRIKLSLNGSAGWLFETWGNLGQSFCQRKFNSYGLLDYGLGMENLETALLFIVFDVERALTRVEHIPLLLQNSSRFLHCKREKNWGDERVWNMNSYVKRDWENHQETM
jgi:hypothetical protein